MRLLLDTPVLLWALLEPGKLPPGLVQLLEDPACQLLAAQAWVPDLELASIDAVFARFEGVRVRGA